MAMVLFSARDIGKSADTRWLAPGHVDVASDQRIAFVQKATISLVRLSVKHNTPHVSDTTTVDYKVKLNGTYVATIALAANADSATSAPGGYLVADDGEDIEVYAVKSSPLADGRLGPVVTLEF